MRGLKVVEYLLFNYHCGKLQRQKQNQTLLEEIVSKDQFFLSQGESTTFKPQAFASPET